MTTNFTPLRLSRPFIRCFVESTSLSVNSSANSGPAAERQKLANYWVHIHSENAAFTQGNGTKTGGLTFAARMGALGIYDSEYRNGSYVAQGTQEAQLMEGTAALARALHVFWPGSYGGPHDLSSTTRHTLLNAVSSSATSVIITTYESGVNNAPTAAETSSSSPPFEKDTWPYWVTKSTAATSTSTQSCISWIRIDNELMRVNTVSFSGTTVNLGVTRGFFSTTTASHSAGAKVFSPVYIGSVSTGDDASLSGNPAQNLSSRPLRYAIRIWTADGYGFIGDRIEAVFLKNDATNPWQGYNSIWFDVSGPNMYNHGDAWGHTVNGWNDRGLASITSSGAAKFSSTTWAEAQKDKFAGLRARSGWANMNFFANGAGQNWALWKSSGLGSYVAAGISEQFFPTTAGIADTDVGFTFDTFREDRNSIFWLRPNRTPAEPDTAKHRRYCYGLVLLAFRTSATRYQFGGGGLGNIYSAATSSAVSPPDVLMWNFGAPNADPTDVNDAILDTGVSGLKKRDYANARIYVNFNSTAVNVALGGNFYDIVNTVSGNPGLVSGTISVPARDARFLLTEAAVTGSVSTISGTGISSAEAFGSGTVSGVGALVLTGTGIASAEAFGLGVVQITPDATLQGVGVASEEVFGLGECVVEGGRGTEGGDPDTPVSGQPMILPGDIENRPGRLTYGGHALRWPP